MVKLGDICDIKSGGTPSRSNANYWNNGNIPWIKISDFNNTYIENTEEFITKEGLDNSSAKMIKKGSILFTIFATLGEVAILNIDATTNQAIASLTISDESVKQKYLYYFLCSLKDFVNGIGRGVAQNNINLKILKNISVPIPSSDKQNKIIKILDNVNCAIDCKKQQLLKLNELVKSRFIEMFGDPVSNSKNIMKLTLPELGELGRGVSKHRPRNAIELLGGQYPLIQTGDVANADLYIKEYTETYSEFGLNQSKMWDKGTLCITIAANIAKTAILNFNACFPDSIVGFNANSLTNNIYIHYWFSFFQAILEKQAPESAQKNINLKVLSELKVIVPIIELQNEFVEFVQVIDKSKLAIEKSIEKLEILKKSLMQEYFG